jgi:hypothetical protein
MGLGSRIAARDPLDRALTDAWDKPEHDGERHLCPCPVEPVARDSSPSARFHYL